MTLLKHCDGEGCKTVSRNVPVTVHGKTPRGKELILHACSAECLDDLIDRFFPEQAPPVPPVPAVAQTPPPSATTTIVGNETVPVTFATSPRPPVFTPRTPATFGRPS